LTRLLSSQRAPRLSGSDAADVRAVDVVEQRQFFLRKADLPTALTSVNMSRRTAFCLLLTVSLVWANPLLAAGSAGELYEGFTPVDPEGD